MKKFQPWCKKGSCSGGANGEGSKPSHLEKLLFNIELINRMNLNNDVSKANKPSHLRAQHDAGVSFLLWKCFWWMLVMPQFCLKIPSISNEPDLVSALFVSRNFFSVKWNQHNKALHTSLENSIFVSVLPQVPSLQLFHKRIYILKI